MKADDKVAFKVSTILYLAEAVALMNKNGKGGDPKWKALMQQGLNMAHLNALQVLSNTAQYYRNLLELDASVAEAIEVATNPPPPKSAKKVGRPKKETVQKEDEE